MGKKLAVLGAVPFLLFWHWFEPAARQNQKGVAAYREKRYEQALQHFLSAKGRRPDSPALRNNTASALYELKKYQESLEEFSRMRASAGGPDYARQQYSMGNGCYRLQQWERALEFYKKCLLARPEDYDAKRNYELTLKKIAEQQQQPQSSPPPQARPNPQNEAQMRSMSRNEKEQLEKRPRPLDRQKREKDW